MQLLLQIKFRFVQLAAGEHESLRHLVLGHTSLFIHNLKMRSLYNPVGKRAGLYTQLCFPDEVEEADIT